MKGIIDTTIFIVFTLFISCSGDDSASKDIIRAPEKASLVYPENNTTCLTIKSTADGLSILELYWEPSEHTDHYDLNITNLEDQTEHHFNNLTQTSKSVALHKAMPYAWQVTSKSNDTTAVTKSETWLFYIAGEAVINYAPFPATLISPTNASTIDPAPGTVTLSWETQDPDGDEILYTILFDTAEDPQATSTELQDLNVTQIEVPIEPNTTYFWRVLASDGTNTSYSQIRWFKTD